MPLDPAQCPLGGRKMNIDEYLLMPIGEAIEWNMGFRQLRCMFEMGFQHYGRRDLISA